MNDRSSGALARAANAILSPRACRFGALIFFALLLLIGAIPGKAEAVSAVVYDKLLHLMAYSVLAALVYGAMPGGVMTRALRSLLMVAILGATDEVIQSLFSYRNASWTDWSIDVLAAVVAISILSGIKSQREADSDIGTPPQ